MATRTEPMPDQLTCTKTPVDQDREPMQAERQYEIDGKRVMCFEVDDGTLWVQRCYWVGAAVPGTRPQAVSELPPHVHPRRLDD